MLYFPLKGASSIAFVLFVAGAITDWADGYYARRQGLVSDFGKLMDALTDKIFMLGLFIALAVMEILPGVWSLFAVLLILSREFLITGLLLIAASSGIVLAAEKSGKLKTVTQMLAAILLLLAVAVCRDFSDSLPDLVGDTLYWAGVVFFVLATMLTVSSGTLYLTKYWSIFKGDKQTLNIER